MKFKVDGKTAAKAIGFAMLACDATHYNEVATTLRIDATEDAAPRMVVTSTDFEVTIQAVVPAEVIEAGAICVPGRKLGEFAKTFDGPITFGNQGTGLGIKAGTTRCKIGSMNLDQFPKISVSRDETFHPIPAAMLAEGVRCGGYCWEAGKHRYIVHGIAFHFQDAPPRISVVSTDGSKALALWTQNMDAAPFGDVLAVVPPKSVEIFTKALKLADNLGAENIYCSLTEYSISLWFDDVIMVRSQLLTGIFPDYRTVIPDGGENHTLFGMKELRTAMKRAALFVGSEEEGRIAFFRFDTDGKLRVHARDSMALDEAEIVVEFDGEIVEEDGATLAFRPDKVLAVLKALSDEEDVLWQWTPNRPVRITGSNENTVHVLMSAEV